MSKQVLFFCCDQLLYNALGYAGHAIVKTPNLDRLALKSTNFKHAFSANPVCVPARISMFTGQYSHRHGQQHNSTPVRPATVMLPDLLHAANIHSGAIGKLHILPVKETRRFDTVRLHDGWGQDSDYIKYLRKIKPELAEYEYSALPVEKGQGVLFGKDIDTGKSIEALIYGQSQIPEEYSYTRWMADETIEFLGAHRAAPFFLFVSFCGPHSPFMVPAPYDKLYDPDQIPLPATCRENPENFPLSKQRQQSKWGTSSMSDEQIKKVTALYYGHITLIDKYIGKILDQLEADNRLDEMMIIFSADHGELLANHGMFYKGTMHDEALRVPLLIHMPGQQAGKISETMVSQVDFMPTILDFLGCAIPPWNQGLSMMPVLNGEQMELRSEIFAENHVAADTPRLGYRTKEWLLAYEIKKGCFTGEGELYNLQADPLQINNLFNTPECQDQIAQFKNRMLHWFIHTAE